MFNQKMISCTYDKITNFSNVTGAVYYKSIKAYNKIRYIGYLLQSIITMK